MKSIPISQKAFCDKIGVSKGYITNMVSGFGRDVLFRIKSEFPDLSINWLLYGEGEMLNSQLPAVESGGKQIPFFDVEFEALGHSYGSNITGVYIQFKREKIDVANRKVIDYALYGKKGNKLAYSEINRLFRNFNEKNSNQGNNRRNNQPRTDFYARFLRWYLHNLCYGVRLAPVNGINTQLHAIAPLRFRLCYINGIALHPLNDINAVSQPHTINAHGRLDKRVYAHAFNWHIDFLAAAA